MSAFGTPIRNPEGEDIACAYHPGQNRDPRIVVLGHGLTSDKDRPWSERLAEGLAAEGVAALRIAFSGNGASGGRFEDSTLTKEVADLGAVLDALPGRRVSYVGHSMGGAVGALCASEDRRIRGLVSLAAIAHPAEFVRRMFGPLRHGDPMLGKAHCPYGPALEQDLLALDSLVGVAPRIEAPWLLVHGGADDVVPAVHSRDMHAAAGPNAELHELPGVDHSFSGAGLEQMAGVVLPWLLRHA